MRPPLALTAISVFATLMVGTVRAETIHFVTENYPPFSFREGDQLKGTSVDLVNMIAKGSGIDDTIELMPWARALGLAMIEPGYCVFTTVHSAERDQKFKWVEPMLHSKTLLVRRAGASVKPKTLEEAKAYRVGTQRGDFTESILEEHHFPKIDLAADLDLTMKKLMNDRIDLMPLSDKYYDKLRREGVGVEAALTLAESTYSIACNKSIPDAVIGRMQSQLDRLIADGTRDRLFKQYGLTTTDTSN
jgi:polar amino acid transport system substrate-binding protein